MKVTYGRPYMRGRQIFGAAGDTVVYGDAAPQETRKAAGHRRACAMGPQCM